MTKKELEEENKILKAKIGLLMPKKSAVTNTKYRFAFEIDGQRFFKWNTVEDIPLNRKIFIDGFIKSTNLVMSLEDQKEAYAKVIQITLDPRYEDKKKLENIRLLSIEVMKRIQMLSLPKMIFRLMAMLYITESDDLEADLPSAEIERRAILFESVKKKTFEEIFSPPMANLLAMNLSTETDSKQSLKQRKELINNLQASQFIADYTQKLIQSY